MMKKTPLISWLLSIIIIFQFLPIDVLDLINEKASAAEETSWTIDYESLTATSAPVLSGVLDNKSQLDSKEHTFDALPGKLISSIKANMPNGSTADVTPSGAVNQPSWTGVLHLTASSTLVYLKSKKNESTKGYYAWYRYTPGDPHGTDWYEDKPSSSMHCASSDTEMINGMPMPKYPGCSDPDLSLSATRNNAFVLQSDSTVEIPSTVVDPSTLYYTATMNTDVQDIDGPTGITPGPAYKSSKTFGVLASYDPNDPSNPDRFIVNYGQTFDEDSGYSKTLGLPGAKMMVYYAAFYVDITAASRLFPATVTITYKDAPSGANLSVSAPSAADACFTSAQNEHLTTTVSNNGTQDVNITITGNFRADGVQFDTFTIPGGLKAGQSITVSTNYTFSMSKSITVVVDPSPGEVSTSDNTAFQAFSPSNTCTTPENIHAVFSIQKPTIVFGDTNGINSIDVSVTGGSGCGIQEVAYTVSQNGNSKVFSSNSAFSFNTGGLPPNPGWMTVGTVSVSLTVKSTCGGQKTAPSQSFQVTQPPQCTSSNRAPVFHAGWFDKGNSSGYDPKRTAIYDTDLWLRIIKEPITYDGDHIKPFDPDGDPYFFTWDFDGSSSAWVRQLKTDYDLWEHEPDGWTYWFHGRVLGTHSVKVTATDVCGNQSMDTATIDIVPPNPVPVITLPPKVVESRPFAPDISCASSYSPRGASISSCDWHGTKQSIYPTAGNYGITLDVTDSYGLTSLSPDNKTLTVLPDAPPIAQLQYVNVGVRGSTMSMKDTSYSPDGDPISEHTTALACDTNNNGSYADEIWKSITPDATGNFTYSPTQVGKCRVHIHIREGLGLKKSDDKDFDFEIVNDGPSTDLSISGTAPTPPIINSSTPTPSTMLNSSSWIGSSTVNANHYKSYHFNSGEGALETYGNKVNQPKSITGNNVSRNVVMYGSCSTNDSSCTDRINFASMIKPGLFASYNNLFSGYVDNKCCGYNYTLTVPRSLAANVDTANAENDLLLSSFAYSGTCSWCNTRYDYLYRISDIDNAFKNATQPSPVQQQIVNKTDPYPSLWVPPPVKQIEGGAVIPVTWHPDPIYGTSYGLPSNNFYSTYNNDFKGNTYRSDCTYQYTQSANGPLAYCNLVKINGSGGTVWATGIINSGYNYRSIDIVYINADSSRIVVHTSSQSTENYLVIDNNTGNVLSTDSSTWSSGSNYLGAFGNKIAFWNYFMTPDYANGWTLSFRDMVSGVLTTTPYIKKYASNCGDTCERQYSLMATVSGDGKLIVANYYSEVLVYDFNGNQLANIPGLGGDPNADTSSSNWHYWLDGMRLAADGDLYIGYTEYYGGSSDGYNDYQHTILRVKTDIDNSPVETYGQLYDSTKTFTDADASVQVKFQFDSFVDSGTTGLAFHVQDNKNMYRVEASPRKVSLVKYVNGTKTVLQTYNYNFNFRQYYELKAKIRGNRIKVYVAGVPLLDVTDSAFPSGSYGPYSEVPYVLLKNTMLLTYDSSSTVTPNVALVGTSLNYSTNYTDPENDPQVSSLSKWTFQHTIPNKFLNAGDGYSGLSAYHNKTVTSPYLTLDKVGVYKIDYQVPDDPAPSAYKYPNMVFNNYRVYSDPSSQTITIHRQPIAVYTLNVNTDGTITWNDTSYDPDRWLSPFNYSTEATGINYATTRGILNRRYIYTSPSGTTTFGKLTQPQESGTYTVRESVMDEYGAWSDWNEQTVNIAIIPPNQPPAAVLTSPNGTQSNPMYVPSLTPTIFWNQTDPDPGTTFAAFHVVVKDQFGNAVIDSGIQPQGTTANSAQWILPTELSVGQKYQVQVQVSDGNVWSPWSNIGWLITNRPPTAAMISPNGTSAAAPTILKTVRPAFAWNQSDPDPGTTFQYFELQVWNQSNTAQLLSSGQQWQGATSSIESWTASANMPARVPLRVRVRVYDGFTWSAWSADAWFLINNDPIPEFDWAPKPLWEGDSLRLINQSQDPDGDPLTYLWQIQSPDNSTATYTSQNVTVTPAASPGIYRVKLTVSDGLSSASITKAISAAPLAIDAEVDYTPNWLAYHEEQGHQTAANPKDFYSGEIFIVRAVSSAAPVSSVTAWIDTTAVDGSSLQCSVDLALAGVPNHYAGELFNDAFLSLTAGLPKGLQTIHFQIRYTNGVVKKQDIPVRILGPVLETVGVHRIR